MKKHYTFLLSILVVECIVLSFLNQNNVKVQSWIGNAIGTFLFILPVQVLLFLLGKDKQIAEKKRKWSKIVFWYITICYLLGVVASLVI